jgi:hypothetical protein
MTTRTPPLLAVGAVMLWASAAAQSPSSVKNLSIPAEPLANALNDLAQQSGLQVMFASELVARLKSPEVKGALTPTEALQRLLTNTGLRYEFVNPQTITIVGPEPKPTAPPAETKAPPAGSEGAQKPQVVNPNHQTADPAASTGDKPMPRRSFFAQLLGLSAACGVALHGGAACAQDTTAAATAAETTTLDTVIVTARKRDESLAQVPESITVFTVADPRELQHPVLRRLRHQDAQHLLRLRRRSHRHRGCPHDRDSRHHGTEPVRHRGRHRLLHRRHAGARLGGSASARHRQHRSAQGPARVRFTARAPWAAMCVS